jgi:hypothetical protein
MKTVNPKEAFNPKETLNQLGTRKLISGNTTPNKGDQKSNETAALIGTLSKVLAEGGAIASNDKAGVNLLESVTKLSLALVEIQSTISKAEKGLAELQKFAQAVDQGAANRLNFLTQQIELLQKEIQTLRGDPEILPDPGVEAEVEKLKEENSDG